jgi:hypothetical protein
MDTKTILSQAKARFSHNQNKEYLKSKYLAKLLVANQGGLWRASPELISFLALSKDDTVILLDSYENPVLVNRIELLDTVHDAYNATMNLWYTELKELENNR